MTKSSGRASSAAKPSKASSPPSVRLAALTKRASLKASRATQHDVAETVEQRIERVFREVTPVTAAITRAIRAAVREQQAVLKVRAASKRAARSRK